MAGHKRDRPDKLISGKLVARRKSPATLILGTWRSDKNRTVKDWVYPKRLADKRRKRFEAIFGHLVLRFTKKLTYEKHDGKTKAVPYKVIWSSAGAVFPQLIVIYGSGADEKAQHIFFDSDDTFYVQGGKCAEFFKRVRAKRSFP